MPKLQLTDREREVVLLAAEGLTDKEIAIKMGIAHGTVATHWVRMRERTGMVNRAQIVARAMGEIFRQAETERTRLSGLYTSLIDSLEDFAVFLMDRERRVVSWNPGVGKILGYEEEEWLGQLGDVIFTPEENAAGVPDQEQTTAEREGKAMDDRWHVRKDGSRFWASGVMTPVRVNGEIACFSKILRDLTPMKRLEERLREACGDADPA